VFVLLATFDNYIPAHIALGKLKDEFINCYLQDELYRNNRSVIIQRNRGIKLMVAESQAERALDILNQKEE
jgi:hypothetical protein